MAHPNEDLVRRGFAAFGTGDTATLSELFADDLVWHAGGRSPISGDYKGKAEVLGLFGQLAERAGGTFRIDIHDVLANDEHVVALVKVTAEREGKTLNDNGAQVFHVQGGKVTESWFHPGDQYASDAFWS
ncbi:MAG: nuclear transport factor 2 family protein [Aeromicrobium sp.]